MDSAGFYVLTKNFSRLSKLDADALEQLSEEFPYSQLVHLLQARASQDLGFSNKSTLLNLTAVYATDRSVLKWVMTTTQPQGEAPILVLETKVEVKAEPPPKEVLIENNTTAAVKVKVVEPDTSVPLTTTTLTDDALLNDIYIQLEKLKKSKHNFEVSLEEFQKTNSSEAVDSESRHKTKVKEVADPLLEEIKSSKKKLKLDNPKQKEQNEIIDQFIKTQPIIPKAKPIAPATDLSEESSAFSDGIVSETLVDILLKQGKKEKAIEVLKKLIWKFPQKKAYFAAQIEDLKN